MLAFFHSLGDHLLSKQFLKRTAIGFEIEETHIFIIGIDILSSPWVLLESSDLIIFSISYEKISKVKIFYLVLKLLFVMIELLFPIVVHCLLNKSLNKFWFYQKN